ncbi:lytic transglycosylase domain-containing protein [Erwinia sp. JH02]|uniref:lytic transglycosylase domain-containing protein n=1 Tax=Erwinia sp. JH02 TaxID=2733394 RepID=UPI001488A81F|nr:lytic transglycosylase domain-containing protein [Erwinia sp. JH02]NNS07343.1 lytic transglycosylase domain-containing protein [Erwinia sp. JH02]
MIIEELAYKVTVKADEFISGKKKVEQGAKDLEKTVTGSMDEASDSSKKVGTEVGKMGQSVKRTAEDTKRPFGLLSGGFYGVAKGAKEFGKEGGQAFGSVATGAAKFLGLALSIEGTRRLFESSTKNLVDLGNASSNLDVSARSLDGWKKAAQSAGASGDSVVSALGKMKNAQNQFDAGMMNPDETTVSIRRLEAQAGVNIIGTGSPEEMFKNMEAALRKLPKSQAQTYAQMLGLDSSILPSILNGSLDSQQSKFSQNSSVNDQMIKTAREANEMMTRLGQSTESIGNNLLLAFGPDIIDVMNTFNQWVSSNGGNVIDFFKESDKWVRQFSSALQGNKNAIHDWGQVTDNFNIFSGFNKSEVDAPAWLDEKLKGNPVWELWKANKDKDIFGAMKGSGSYDEERLLDAVMHAESGGNPNAVSRAGATGPYQFMSGTARDMGLRVDGQVDERRDPAKSREAARKYLNQLINRYGGNVDLALKAYNVGPTALDRWIKAGSNPNTMNSETANYVGRVSKNYGSDLSQMAALSAIPDAPQSSDNSQTSTTHIGKVEVNTNPQTVDQLMDGIIQQARRSSTNGAFISGNG